MEIPRVIRALPAGIIKNTGARGASYKSFHGL